MPRRHVKTAVVAAGAIAVGLGALGSASATAVPPISVTVTKAAKLAPAPSKAVTTSGVIKCQKGHRYKIVAALVQKVSGAYAQASYPAQGTQKTCTGGFDHWTVSLTPKSSAFKAGVGEMCVLASTQAKKVGATGLGQACNLVTIAAAK